MTVARQSAFPLRNRGADDGLCCRTRAAIAGMIGMEDMRNPRRAGLTAGIAKREKSRSGGDGARKT